MLRRAAVRAAFRRSLCAGRCGGPTLVPRAAEVEQQPRGELEQRARIAWSIELEPCGLLASAGAAPPASPGLPLRSRLPLLARLPAGTRVYLPWLPADPPSAIDDALSLIRQENPALVPVPHVCASRVESLESLDRRIAGWQRATSDGVREVMVAFRGSGEVMVRGSRRGDGASRDSGLWLLESGVLQRCGIRAVSLPGYPEASAHSDGAAGHGGSPGAERETLAAMLSWASASAVEARVVSRFCFDVATTTAYVDSLRADGIDADVSVGLVGPDVSNARRRQLAAECGIAPPSSPYATPYLRKLAVWQAERGAALGAQALHLHPSAAGLASVGRTLGGMWDFSNDASRRADGSRYPSLALEPPPPEPPYERVSE